MDVTNLNEQFQSIFQTLEKPRVFFAPGRINLIGEHTDYNGGHVFPAAISFGTYALVRKRTDQKLRFYSFNFSEDDIIECSLDHTAYDESFKWANFPRGMIHYLIKQGYEISEGLDVIYVGNIPNSAGLSSSASIEMVTGMILNEIFSLQIEPIELAKIGQQVENHYIGVNSGIMDQFAIMMGKRDHGIHLHTETLTYHYAPIELTNYSIMIMHTNKRR